MTSPCPFDLNYIQCVARYDPSVLWLVALCAVCLIVFLIARRQLR
jgi:hypothetical protein